MSTDPPFPASWPATTDDRPADRPGGGSGSLAALLGCLGDKVEQHQRKIRAQQELIVELVDAVGALAAQLQVQRRRGATREASAPGVRPADHRDSAYCSPGTSFDSHSPSKGGRDGPAAAAVPPRRAARRPAWDPTPLRPQPRIKTAAFAPVTSRLPRKRSEASSSLAALQAELQRRGGPERR